MVKLGFVEKPSQELPSKPISVLRCLVMGFDKMTSNPILILPPLLLDLFLWLGPHMSIQTIARRGFVTLLASAEVEPAFEEQMGILEQGLLTLAERINLFSALSAVPAGVPSFMNGRLPIDTPFGAGGSFEVLSPQAAFLYLLVITIIGLGIGAFYNTWIARAVAEGDPVSSGWISWRRLVGLAFLMYVALVILCIGTLLLASLVALVVPLFGLSVLFAGYSFVVLMAVYFTFAPHGIVRYRLSILKALWDSVFVVRWNTLSTVGFLSLALGLSWLTSQIWGLPGEASWFSLLGLLGHAFISGTLLAASYIFYQGRRNWVLDRGGSSAIAHRLRLGMTTQEPTDQS